jgi:hypothetical protein
MVYRLVVIVSLPGKYVVRVLNVSKRVGSRSLPGIATPHEECACRVFRVRANTRCGWVRNDYGGTEPIELELL